MNRTKLITAIAAALVAGAPLVASADNDKCRNIKFKFTNEHPTNKRILIMGISYRNVVNNRTDSVTFTIPKECPAGDTCTTQGWDLRDVEGENINKIRFTLRYTENDGGMSSDAYSKEFSPNHKECRADRVYGPGNKGFVIDWSSHTPTSQTPNPNGVN